MIPTTALRRRQDAAFTRIELMVMTATLSVLGAVSVVRLGHAGGQSASVSCLNNHRALAAAWAGYANDHAGLVVNNLTLSETLASVTAKTYLNWANNFMTWEAGGLYGQSTTNLDLVSRSQLFPYLQSNLFAFKCPADTYLSAVQHQAGFQWRTRSYSMNAFVGQAYANNDPAAGTGKNQFFPRFRQFLQLDSIPVPAATFVFLDEHPDSINDGLYLNDPSSSRMWTDEPASYHNGGCSFSFADSHAELHQWASPTTIVPVRYNYTSVIIPPTQNVDYLWVAARTSVDPTQLALSRSPSNQLQIVWSALPTNYILQSSDSLASGSWTNVPAPAVLSPGQRATTQDINAPHRFFRLIRP